SKKSKSSRKHRKSKQASSVATGTSGVFAENKSSQGAVSTSGDQRVAFADDILVKKMVVTTGEQSGGWMRRAGSSRRSAYLRIKRTKYVKTWLTQFTSYVQLHYTKSFSSLSVKERHKVVRAFCSQHFATYDERFFRHGTSEEKRIAWRLCRSLSYMYPEIALITVTETSVSGSKHVRQTETSGALVRFADDMLFVAGVAAGAGAAQTSSSGGVVFEKHSTFSEVASASAASSTTSFETKTVEGEVVTTTETKQTTTVVHHTHSVS
ncbi:hypothetical protein PybrP1_007868, partial [[Pythium] brassicae (nom. inval.)]